MSRWFRHYAGMVRDDKLVRVALRSRQTVERVVWIWGAILESAAEIDDDGRYDLDGAETSYFLRADECDVDAILRGLADAGRVAEGRVVKWGNRQFSSDRSKERVAAHRQRKRQEKPSGDGGAEERNDAVTLHGATCNAPETELDTDTDSAEPNGSTGAAAPSAIDLRAAVFASGVPLLIAGGLTERNARSMLGRWRSVHQDGPVLDALAAAQARSPSDPVPYIRRTLENRNAKSDLGLRGSRPDPSLDLLRAAEAEERADRNQASRGGAWAALPASGTG